MPQVPNGGTRAGEMQVVLSSLKDHPWSKSPVRPGRIRSLPAGRLLAKRSWNLDVGLSSCCVERSACPVEF